MCLLEKYFIGSWVAGPFLVAHRLPVGLGSSGEGDWLPAAITSRVLISDNNEKLAGLFMIWNQVCRIFLLSRRCVME